ncbi:hypothetical protein FB451DRAFT_1341984 [Mycena latifolia]|nr:hypothetical protein FB451DRAFT_1341984 [Mycena latifolia]
MSVSGPALEELLNAFRAHYRRYENAAHDAVANSADAVVLWRLGDDLDQYIGLVNEYSAIFPADELNLISQNVAAMQNDVRLQIDIDVDFLRWAYSLRSTESIARFLGVGRSLVRRALLEHEIAVPPYNNPPEPSASHPPAQSAGENNGNDYLVDPEQAPAAAPAISSFTGPLSTISDDELDNLLIHLRRHYRRAGITMFDGMLRRLGHHRITIRRRTYHVPGPNSLWHHDGQHDCRSVHNVRIERLWADVTAQIGATWADLFTVLEIRHGLDINNVYHIWLLHYLFLRQINNQLRFFMEAWNQHQIQIRDGPNRSPVDMFGFNMIVHGVRGTNILPEEQMSADELEVYGVDWEALHDDNLLESRQENNPPDEGSTSWIGRQGPPERLNELAFPVIEEHRRSLILILSATSP